MEPLDIFASPRQVRQWRQDREKRLTTERSAGAAYSSHCCNRKERQAGSSLGKLYALLLLLTLLLHLPGVAQTSQQKSSVYKSLSPATDHYKYIGATDATPTGEHLDSISFPAKDFRRGAYLKLRTVYLDVPVKTFKIKPYPANSSAQTRAELDFLLDLQQKRTATDIARTDTMAVVYYDPFTVNLLDPDYSRNVNSLFYIGRPLGPWFNPEQLPVTKQVLQNVMQDATFYFFSLKAQFNRPRPYHIEPHLHNLEAPGHASYPSGHSSASYVHAYLLSHVLPAYKEQFLSNAYDMAFSREIRGVHYPSDSEAGKEFAAQFVAQLMKRKKFKADYLAMEAEINKAMNEYKITSTKTF
ncbi:phosphatase PAP2 family protein [Pontibacter korlensis]|uniref:phosphatase PAP2 family protein n=1 Tax=Pontibacter korlensis TaxID=400092 RepID=UPI00061B2CD0|nr:phosphatase PAP2 family protein [Pontibacter korlensis]